MRQEFSERERSFLICPFCGSEAEYVDSAVIYRGRSYGMVWLCANYNRGCKSFVGVHKGTARPLGYLANEEMRSLRKRAHEVFDILWKGRWLPRAEAYQKMADVLKIDRDYAHISQLTIPQLQVVIEFFGKYSNAITRTIPSQKEMAVRHLTS